MKNIDLKIPKNKRLIIIEGVAGSGKDTLQKLLKEKFKDKEVHSYSEGEVLFSWKHARIKGIAKLRLKFMRTFLDYIKEMLNFSPVPIFLLNRFHLSTYMAHVSKNKEFKKDYDIIVEKIKQLPSYILLLQLNAEDIEQRSKHSERPTAWIKYQKSMVKKEGFKNRTERYLNEQKLMLQAAKADGIPYKILQFEI